MTKRNSDQFTPTIINHQHDTKTKDIFLLSAAAACQIHRKTKSRLCKMKYLQNTEHTLTQHTELGA